MCMSFFCHSLIHYLDHARRRFLSAALLMFLLPGTIVVKGQCFVAFSHTVYANGLVYFDNNSFFIPGTSYTWDFGDASPQVTVTNLSGQYHYFPNGTFSVTLAIVTPSALCTDSVTHPVNVNTSLCNVNIIPQFSYANTVGTYSFAGSAINTSSAATYFWNFGDNTFGNGPTPFKTYSLPGTYNVKLAVTEGVCTDTIVQSIPVNLCSLNAAFTPSNVGSGQVKFINNSSGTVSATSYYWIFGDGGVSTSVSPVHTYSTNGNFSVSLQAAHNTSLTGNCSSQTSQLVAPVFSTSTCSISASFAHVVGTNGLVSFSSTSTGTNSATKFYWDFGDGYIGQGKTIPHAYATAGAYLVKLKVYNDSIGSACSDSLLQSLNVTGLPCTANASFSLSPTPVPQYWNLIPSYPWNVSAAIISWGDGSSSNSLFSSHTYSSAGTYSICLSVTVSCGATSSTCVSSPLYKGGESDIVTVNVTPPPAKVTDLSSVRLSPPSVKIYPNPAKNVLFVDLENLRNFVSVSLVNLLGQEVRHDDGVVPDEGKIKIPITVNDLPEGMYFLNVAGPGSSSTHKILVEN